MSDTELDVSSLASADDGALVFPDDEEEEEDVMEEEEEEEDEEDEYETEEEEELLFEEVAMLEGEGIMTPFLLVPEEDLERYVVYVCSVVVTTIALVLRLKVKCTLHSAPLRTLHSAPLRTPHSTPHSASHYSSKIGVALHFALQQIVRSSTTYGNHSNP